MNNFKAKNIILNLSGTSGLPHSTPNDVIIKDDQSISYGFNNSVQQLANNDAYIYHMLKLQAENQPGPERLTDDALAKTIDNYKYLHIDSNDISILQKHEIPISATITQHINNSNAKKIFKDGRYFVLANDGIYATTNLDNLNNSKIYNFTACDIQVAYYDEDDHILLFGGNGNGLKGKLGVAYNFEMQNITVNFIDLYCNNEKIDEIVTAIDYASSNRRIYVGTQTADNIKTSSGYLYFANAIEFTSLSLTKIDLLKTQPIDAPVLDICKLSGINDDEKMFIGTFGQGLYESSYQYSFSNIKDVCNLPDRITITCFHVFREKQYIGTTNGLLIVQDAQTTECLNGIKINAIKEFDDKCYIATDNGLYVFENDNPRLITSGTVVDMCQKADDLFAIAGTKGVKIAKDIETAEFKDVEKLNNESIISIVALDDFFYMATEKNIYKVDIEYINQTISNRQLVSLVNSEEKTFGQITNNAIITKVVEDDYNIYLFTNNGLYDAELNKKYDIDSEVYNMRKYAQYKFVCTSTGLYIVRNDIVLMHQYKNNEVYDVTYDGNLLYVAINSTSEGYIESIICIQPLEDALQTEIDDISDKRIDHINGDSIVVNSQINGLAIDNKKLFIVAGNKLQYIQIDELFSKAIKSEKLILNDRTITEVQYVTENYTYYARQDNSDSSEQTEFQFSSKKYIGLKLDNGYATYYLNDYGSFDPLDNNEISNFLPKMMYNPSDDPSDDCKVKNLINIGDINNTATIFTNTADKCALYAFDYNNTVLSDVNISSSAELADNQKIKKIQYSANINCILDVTTPDNTVEYGITNNGGIAFLVGTDDGLYLQNEKQQQIQLSALDISGLEDIEPIANITNFAVAEFASYEKETKDAGNVYIEKELLYVAASGSNLLSSCSIEERENGKKNKHNYADFKAHNLSAQINKIQFLYQNNVLSGIYIATESNLQFAEIEFKEIEFKETEISSKTLKVPSLSVSIVETNYNGNQLVGDFKDIAIINNRLYAIVGVELYCAHNVENNRLQLNFEKLTDANGSVPQLNSFIFGIDNNNQVVGLCIGGSSNNVLYSIQHGESFDIASDIHQYTFADNQIYENGTFSQLAVLQQFSNQLSSNQLMLGVKARLKKKDDNDSKNYIAYITGYADTLHILRIVDGADGEDDETYRDLNLNIFNTFDAATGNIIGYMLQVDNKLLNINFKNISVQQKFQFENDVVNFDEYALEILNADNINNENNWFAVLENDYIYVNNGNTQSNCTYNFLTTNNKKAILLKSSNNFFDIQTTINVDSNYNILQEKTTCFAKATINDYIVIAAGIGNTVQVFTYDNGLIFKFKIDEQQSPSHVCFDLNNNLLLYAVNKKVKYIKFKIDNDTNNYSILKDGDTQEIRIENSEDVLGLFELDNNAYIITKSGLYEPQNAVVSTIDLSEVDPTIDDNKPTSIDIGNSIIVNTEIGQFKHQRDLIFENINNKYDSFATNIDDVEYAVKHGKLFIREKIEEYENYVRYEYNKSDSIYDELKNTIVGCYKNENFYIVTSQDIKYVYTTSYVKTEQIQTAELLYSDFNINKLILNKNNIIAYNNTTAAIISENTINIVNLGISIDAMQSMQIGIIAFDNTQKKLYLIENIAKSIKTEIKLNKNILNQFIAISYGYILLNTKLLTYDNIDNTLYFMQIADTDNQVVNNIVKIDDNELLCSKYVANKDKNKTNSVFWFKNKVFIKNQIHRNVQIDSIVDLNMVDLQTYKNMYAVAVNKNIYVNQNDKFTSWKLLFNMANNNISLSDTINDIVMFTPYEYAIATNKGVFCTKYKYFLTNNFDNTTQYDINNALDKFCLSSIDMHLQEMHSTSTTDGKFIDAINNQLMFNDFSDMSRQWQHIDDECTIIENDVVEHVEFGATDMHVSALVANEADKDNWIFVDGLTYIDKQYMSNMHELYVHLPTTYTNYIPLPIFSDSQNALSGLIKQNITNIRLLLDPKHYDIQEMLEVQINANSFPLMMSQTTAEYSAEGKMFHSYALPSISRYAALVNNVGADAIPTLSGMYMFEFACFGTDEQSIKLTFKSKNKYTVQFKADKDVYGFMEDQIFTLGETQALKKNNYYKDGCLFKNWKYIDADGESVKYKDEQQIVSTFDNNNKSFTNINNEKIQLTAEFQQYSFDGNETKITLNSDIAYIESAQNTEYTQTIDGETIKLKGVVIDFGA